jgi:hypothetical protein
MTATDISNGKKVMLNKGSGVEAVFAWMKQCPGQTEMLRIIPVL